MPSGCIPWSFSKDHRTHTPGPFGIATTASLAAPERDSTGFTAVNSTYVRHSFEAAILLYVVTYCPQEGCSPVLLSPSVGTSPPYDLSLPEVASETSGHLVGTLTFEQLPEGLQ